MNNHPSIGTINGSGMSREISAYVDHDGDLCDYQTGDYLRAATVDEQEDSKRAATIDGGAGVIRATV